MSVSAAATPGQVAGLRSGRSRRLGDLAGLDHGDPGEDRLKGIRQGPGIVDDLPSDQRTVRGSFEQDALLARREYYSVSALILALDQPGQDGHRRGYSPGGQRVTEIGEAAIVTQKAGQFPYLQPEQLF